MNIMSSISLPVFLRREPGNGHKEAFQSKAFTGVLRTNRLLRHLSDSEFSELLGEGRWVAFRPHEVVSHQAKPVEAILFIAEGRAKAEVYRPTDSSLKVVVNFLGPGDDIGLLSIVDVDVALHSASVITLEKLGAISVSLSSMRRLLCRHGEWYRTLAEIAVDRLRASGIRLQALI